MIFAHFLTFVYLQNVISDCQICIETSVKAMFKLVSVDPPRTHEIHLDNKRTRDFLNAVPEEFEVYEDLPRILFLTQFWHQFYEEAKYGVPELNLTARDIFTIEDAHRAVEDAELSVNAAEQLLDLTE